jgi:ABC-2 type transport system permease protein
VAGLNSAFAGQLRAIGVLRWRLFVNSLRTVGGRLNLVSRSIAALLVLGAAFGGAIALGVVAWGMARERQLQWLAVPFWLVAIFWQVFPIMATAFTQNLDASSLLRFPLSYPGYFLVRLIYGALDIATALGLSWSVGLLIGVSVGDGSLFPWAFLAIATLVAFNLVLARIIFVWIEHWLSSRRSREIMGVLFLLTLVGFQLLGPALGRYSKWPAPQRFAVVEKLLPLERALPPGLAVYGIVKASLNQPSSAFLAIAAIALYVAAGLCILHLRLRDQYCGRGSFAGDKPRTVRVAASRSFKQGWRLPFSSGPVSAIYEKELRYFSRSGPMLFSLVMPVIMVFVLWGSRRALMGLQLSFVFPVGSAYCLLVLTNIVYNSFGADGSGIQMFLFSPVSFRQIAAAKNLAQLTVLALDLAILWLGIQLLFQPPRLRVIVFTLVWLLFATPLNFALGNVLSIYFPKKVDYAVFGRQRASETTILISLGAQLTILGIGAFAVFIAHRYSNLWAGTAVMAVLAVPSIALYFTLLGRLDGIALARRDVLTGELCRA